MDGEIKDTAETFPKKDSFSTSIDMARKGTDTAVEYFRQRAKADDSRYSHLGSIVDEGKILPIDDSEMTQLLIQSGFDHRHASSISAFYLDESGGIKADAVAVRKGGELNPVILLHELIHRAATQRGLKLEVPRYYDQLFDILNFSKEKRDGLKTTQPDKYREELADAKNRIRVFTEGLTQWATLFLANRTQQFSPPVVDEVYSDEVAAVEQSFHEAFDKRGFSQDQVEELMLDLALTGDFSRIDKELPLADGLKQHGFKENYSVYVLVDGAHSLYQIRQYDRILGSQPTEQK